MHSNDSYLSVRDSFVDLANPSVVIEGGPFALLMAIDCSLWRLYQSNTWERATRGRDSMKTGLAMEPSPVIRASLVTIGSGACKRHAWCIASVWHERKAWTKQVGRSILATI